MNHLVIGTGEVGTAIAKILECDGIDKGQEASKKSYKFLHICFPYSEKFVDLVKAYQDEYSPDYTVIHSTVPVGTSAKCHAVHSPVRGVHPHLEEGIRTFVKYFGGEDAYKCSVEFAKRGIQVSESLKSEDTEAGKLWDTTAYGIMIMLEKEIYRWCEQHNLDFSVVYDQFTKTYNQGYSELGRSEVVRPVLKHIQGPIGGHCVINNARLLEDSWLAKALIEKNKEW